MAKCGWSKIIGLATILVSSYLATSISTDNPLVQQRKDRVGRLPGQTFNTTFAHYSGYITVNEESGRTLFYWFIEALQNPQSKPLLLWLNGGPGCSSIAYGQSEEIGPFHINSDGKTLHPNPYSWNRFANILFVDTPAGVGFSYSNKESDLVNNGDKRTAEENLIFLLKWFERFPQYKRREFFMSGESYAGHYVPQLSQVIVKYNSVTKENAINLKGFVVGNALTDDFYDQLGMYEYMWATDSCEKITEIANEEIGNIDPYSLFTVTCHANVSQLNQLMRRKHRIGILRVRAEYDPCTEKHSTVYFNRPEVQRVLHVDPDHKPAKWETCNDVVFTNWKDSPRSVLDIYHELIHLGLRIWMFSGNTDVVIPVTSTRYSINALKLPTVTHWRAWYDDGEVGGWTQEYDGLTFVVVRGAGHEVPLHRPKLALALFKAFLSGTSMPTLELVSAS